MSESVEHLRIDIPAEELEDLLLQLVHALFRELR